MIMNVFNFLFFFFVNFLKEKKRKPNDNSLDDIIINMHNFRFLILNYFFICCFTIHYYYLI